jgi:hypothetical protein
MNRFTSLLQDKRDILTILYVTFKSRDSSVGTATGYGLETKGSEFESRWGQEFSLLHVVQTGSGAHSTSYPMGIGGKAAGA